MNKISWALYWADTLPSLSHAVAVTCVIAAVCLIGMAGIRLIWLIDDLNSYAERGRPLDFTTWLFPVLIVVGLLTNLVPEKDTFYMIAASEVVEENLKTPEVGKVRKIINTWLDEQMQPGEGATQ